MNVPASTPTRLHAAPRIFFTERRAAGISFTERMAGYWSPAPEIIAAELFDLERYEAACREGRDAELFDRQRYEAAYQEGRDAGRSLELVITIVSEDLDNMLADENHQAGFTGTATIEGAQGDTEPLTALVTDGSFRLFVGTRDRIASRKMEYGADIEALDGRRWRLEGFKAIRFGEGTAGFVPSPSLKPLTWGTSGIWRDQTRLFFTLQGKGKGAAEHGLGILSLSFVDLLRQLSTIRARGTTTVTERCDTVARFVSFFGSVLRDTYGGPFARSRYAPPNWWRRKRRALSRGKGKGTVEAEPHCFRTSDGVDLKLTRYKGGKAGAVVLAPGFGVRADSFAIDTVDTNLVEYLCQWDYDVWLFDYRASPELPASREAFSIDDIARIDWPEAVTRVLELSDCDQVHVIAHCVGSMSFMMAMLAGKLSKLVSSAVCSQVGAHPGGSRLNELKALGRMGVWLEALFGVKALRVTVHAEDTYQRPLLDRPLKFYPTEDPCDNPVCRRVRFVFGESYLHANLNRHTHDAIIEMFGDPARGAAAYASLRALKHLAAIVAAERVLTEKGEDTYVQDQNVVDHLDFRLLLMSGAENAIFPPIGIQRTFEWLDGIRAARPSLPDVFQLSVPGYAHMDSFIGARADRDVFRHLVTWLQGRRPDAPAGITLPPQAGSL